MSIDALNDNVNGRKVSLNQPQQQTTFKHDNTTNYRNNNNNSNRGNPPPKGWRETLDLGNVEELSIRIGGELISGGARAPKVNTPTVNREATSPPNPPPVIAHVDPTHSTDVKKAKPRGKTMQHRPYEGGVSISLPENTPSIQYSPHTYTPCEAVKPVICRRSSQSSPRCTHVASGHTDTGNSSPTSPGLAERAPRPLPPPQGQCYRANMLTGFYSGNEEPPLIVPQSLQRPAPRVENANNNTNTNPPNSNTNNDNWNHNRQPPCYNQNNNGRPMNGYPSGQGTPRHLNLSSPRGGRSGNFPPKMNIECFNQVQPFVPVWGYAPPTGGDSNANSANYNNSYNHTPNNNNNSNSNNYSRNSEHITTGAVQHTAAHSGPNRPPCPDQTPTQECTE
ncbi:ubiquitin domain-containing protein [Angomonas deanei]|uniref:Uncharacterized protein n=1 Tax=Angomonas deanei TaxID=59799 RepID=A0A7G2CN64_9TRYP|nr:ubiquitin domain-containing protein [Angomonas deanei]CAD2219652.1 hypothetical protein, conserved [Angomonas deanei]|eukprot:EPY21064.1 ubiquitin domain-containing protein [Angomonas deanei]